MIKESEQIEILDLRHFSASQLRPLLQQEAGVWLRDLRWDYSSSIDLLLQYLDSRILLGFVARIGRSIRGYTFFVYEGAKAVVGDLYVSSEAASPLLVANTLAQHLLGVLEATPGIDRIEAQLLLYETGLLQPLFPGFRSYKRLYLEKQLSRGVGQTAPASVRHLPSDVEICTWNPAFYQASAELILLTYVGHIDAEINDQYRTLDGSLRFLHNVVRFPGCGIFDPEASWVCRDRTTRALVAVVLCSRITPPGANGPVAHITQLCVHPSRQGRGLGHALFQATLSRLLSLEYRSLTLTVTEANRPALNLYLSSQFKVLRRFDALVKEKRNLRDRSG